MSTSAGDPTATAQAPTWRVAPSVPVAIGVFIAYVVVFIGLSSTSGIDYDDWFDSGANAFRTAVIPLIGGTLVLIAFLVWARWDWVFKDPERLPMSGALRVPLVLFVLGVVVHFAVADWSEAPGDLILAILAAGILVGFAEETMFRGIILRSLRTNLRPESWVMLISSLWFGFFHLTNLLNGSPAAGGAQPVRAGLRAGSRAVPVPAGARSAGRRHGRPWHLGHVRVLARAVGHPRGRGPRGAGGRLPQRPGRRGSSSLRRDREIAVTSTGVQSL